MKVRGGAHVVFDGMVKCVKKFKSTKSKRGDWKAEPHAAVPITECFDDDDEAIALFQYIRRCDRKGLLDLCKLGVMTRGRSKQVHIVICKETNIWGGKKEMFMDIINNCHYDKEQKIWRSADKGAKKRKNNDDEGNDAIFVVNDTPELMCCDAESNKSGLIGQRTINMNTVSSRYKDSIAHETIVPKIMDVLKSTIHGRHLGSNVTHEIVQMATERIKNLLTNNQQQPP